MLRRFMSWLLHQLQRFLNLISGHQSPARGVTPSQEKPKAQGAGTAQRESYPATEVNTPNQPGISFSIDSEDSSASQPFTPQPDAIQEATSSADDAETHMRLDAASSTVPGTRSELSDAEAFADEARFSEGEAIASDMASLAPTPSETIPLADHLPSIHDLLPAVEQEIKESAAQRSSDDTARADEPATEPLVSLADSSPSPQPERVVPEPEPALLEIAEPVESIESEPLESDLTESRSSAESEQALLFSFDITESSDDRVSNLEMEDQVEPDAATIQESREGELSDAENVPTLVEDDIDDDIDVVASALTDADISAELPQESTSSLPEVDTELAIAAANDVSHVTSDADTTQSETDSEEAPATKYSDPKALDKASLPYPWSIATPKAASKNEEETDVQTGIQSEALKSMETSVGTTSVTDSDAVAVASTGSVPSQEKQFTTKTGVVKLLFTMKEGNFHGYIEPKDGTSDILFHQKYINEDIFDSLERGVEVVVSVKHIEGKAYATQVELAE